MKLIFFLFILLGAGTCIAQDYFFLNAYREQYRHPDDSTLEYQLAADTTILIRHHTKSNYVRLLRNDTLLESGYRSWSCIDCVNRGKEWSTYYANGHVASTGDYYKGIKTGDWKYYYPTGKLQRIERIFYDFDGLGYYDVKPVLQSEYEYYENGQLKMEGQHEETLGCMDSVYIVDPQTGDMTLQTVPKTCTKKCGTWNYYSPDGTLINKEEY